MNKPATSSKVLERKQKERIARTEKLLASYKDHRHEFDMLKGILCMSHCFEVGTSDFQMVNGVFDWGMVAGRMDAINAAVIAQFKARMLEKAGA